MNPDLKYALILTLSGFAIVFAVLSALAAVLGLIRRSDEGWKVKEKREETEALQRDPNIDATTAVLIAAAVATYIEGRHHIHQVRRLLPRGGSSSGWSSQGRAVLQGSHVITKKSR